MQRTMQNIWKHGKMAVGNLLMKCRLKKPLVPESNASQTNTEKEQWHKLLPWLLQTTKPLFDAWVGDMMEHNPTFINMTNPDRF